ncbi:MAG: acyl--CoA ligase [bacterium]|nr:acyl--CoA ligase [bacterium]
MPDSQPKFSAASWAFRLLTDKPDRTLLIVQGKKVSASALSEEVSLLRGALNQSGLGADHIVAVSCERSITSVAAILACFCEGSIPFLVDPRQEHELLSKLLDAVRIHGLYCGTSLDASGFKARLPYLKWVGESDAQSASKRSAGPESNTDGGFVLHTSGTCGLPRAIQHAGSAIAWQTSALNNALRLKPAMELWYTGTLASPSVFALGLCATLSTGGILVLDEPQSQLTSISRQAENPRILLMSQSSDRSEWNAEHLLAIKTKVTSVMCTDGPLSESFAITVTQATDAPVWNGLSLTEAAGFIAINPVPGVWPADSAGRPISGAEVCIIGSEGKSVGYDHYGKLYYKNAPVPVKTVSLTFQSKSEPASSWVATGDWAKLDENDYLFITGCDKSSFYRAGFLVNAVAIEQSLRSIPNVADVIVFAAPHDEVENEVSAAIIPKNGTIDFALAIQSLSPNIPKYQLPERVSTIDAIPRTPSGKVKRFGYVIPPRTAAQIAKDQPAPEQTSTPVHEANTSNQE